MPRNLEGYPANFLAKLKLKIGAVGLRWPALACVGLRWPVLAFVGLRWPLLACVGLRWPALAFVGRRWLLWAFVGRSNNNKNKILYIKKRLTY